MRNCSTKNSKKKEPWIESCGNIYKDFGFDDQESANLLARATLILQLKQIIKSNGWTQEQAAKTLGVKQPRIAEIMGMKTECFSVDLLLNYLARLGKQVEMTIKDINRAA